MKNSIKITVYPRIHVTLIGMNRQGYRFNGGIGFSIGEPSIKLYFVKSEKFEIIDNRNVNLNANESKRIINILDEIYDDRKLEVKFCCLIDAETPTHYGFGTSTAIRLACIEALMLFNDQSYSADTIKNKSGRGGTSGIGINTYFRGGFVLDVGVRENIQGSFLPSSARENRSKLPLVLMSSEVPNWLIGLLIPHDIEPKSEEQEKLFFKQVGPISKKQVNEILYETVYGVASAIKEVDFKVFCESVNAIQNTAWKKAERLQYGYKLEFYEQMLYRLGSSCVGMSSLGPSLYFIIDDYKIVQDFVKDYSLNCDIIVTKFNNQGRALSYD